MDGDYQRWVTWVGHIYGVGEGEALMGDRKTGPLSVSVPVQNAVVQLRAWADRIEAMGEDAEARLHFVAVWDEEGSADIEALTLGDKDKTSKAFVNAVRIVSRFMQGEPLPDYAEEVAP